MEASETGRWTVRVTSSDGKEDIFDYRVDEATRVVEGVSTSARLLCLTSDADGWETLAEAVALK